MKSKIENIVIMGCSARGLAAIDYLVPKLQLNQKNSMMVIPHIFYRDIYESLRRSGIHTSFLQSKEIRGGRIYVVSKKVGKFGKTLPNDGSIGSIDYTMKVFADCYGNHCIGVILSGCGNDGSIGVQHIKKVGGKVLVQARDSQGNYIYEMPENARKNTEVDFAGPLSKLIKRLNVYLAIKQN